MQIQGDKLVQNPENDYAGGRQGGLEDAKIFRHAASWYDVLKDTPDDELTPEVRGYRDGLKQGLGR